MSLPTSLLPVIDLMNGQVVHARAGLRSQYQPLISHWCERAGDPLALADALLQQFGLNEFYLADLNALEGGGPQREVIASLIECGCQLWLDARIQSVLEAKEWLALGVKHVIIAGETLPSVSVLQQLFDNTFATPLIFSLDLSEGKLRSRPGVFAVQEPLAVVDSIVELGCRQFIVLDTAAVGVLKGPVTLHLCRQIQQRYPQCSIISGGGIRNRADIQQLKDAGVERVLVSTWLHQGCP